jgi:ATP phosphoribosyltransferase
MPVLALDSLPISRSAPVALIPKNRGLSGQLSALCERLVPAGSTHVAVRGEDVPTLANAVAESGRPVVAFTGDDLLDEWLLAGNALHPGLQRRRIAWRDSRAIYGAPALALIGKSFAPLSESRTLRIAVCDRYRRLTEVHLEALRRGGVRLEVVPIAGAVEACIASGVTDLIVDIVVTGRTVAEAGLQVLRVISTSDLAVLETAP